jgi:hypothetical protein
MADTTADAADAISDDDDDDDFQKVVSMFDANDNDTDQKTEMTASMKTIKLQLQSSSPHIQNIVHFMFDAYKTGQKAEMTASVDRLMKLYPYVTHDTFSATGANKDEYNFVRSARCFFMILMFHLNKKGDYHRQVRNMYRSCLSCFINHSCILIHMYLFDIRVVYGQTK